jgi:hypothetical protein
VLATIFPVSIVVMALPLESAEASRERERERERRGGDAVTGDFESDGDGNEGNFAEGGNAVSGAQQAAQIIYIRVIKIQAT